MYAGLFSVYAELENITNKLNSLGEDCRSRRGVLARGGLGRLVKTKDIRDAAHVNHRLDIILLCKWII